VEKIVLTVSEGEEGQRLDIYLVDQKVLPTRSQIQRLIEQERVKVNGFPSKASYKIDLADHITIEIPAPEESVIVPENIPVDILYEDDDLVVIHKRAGQVVHPGAGNKRGTLVNALLYHCKNLSGIGGVMRPGVVHRLDKGTSGVMLFAKNDKAHLHLTSQFEKKLTQRHYKALIFGKMKTGSGSFSEPIGRHPIQRKKMSVHSRKGKAALTYWEVVQSYEQMSLVRATLATGRTHQIRVHFSNAGHPVVGDSTYGGVKRMKGIVSLDLRRALQKLPALLLHAEHLSFTHPTTGKKMSFEVPLPDYFQRILKLLDE